MCFIPIIRLGVDLKPSRPNSSTSRVKLRILEDFISMGPWHDLWSIADLGTGDLSHVSGLCFYNSNMTITVCQ
jgi:hypothetical protein